MKKTLYFALLLCLALLMACGGGSPALNEAQATAEALAAQGRDAIDDLTSEEEETGPAEEATIELVEEATETPVEEPTEVPAAEPTEAPVEEPTEAPVEEAVPAWDFNIQVNQMMRTDGSVRDFSSTFDFVIRLNIEGETITGEYLQTSGNACSDATIDGTTMGDEAQFVITYQNPSCCGGNQMEFRGAFNTDKDELTGTLEPVGVPVGCELWFANVAATSR